MLCRRTRPLPIECVARGYLSGSGWKEYQQTGTVCGIKLPARPQGIRSPAGADLHARDESRDRPRHQHQRRRSREDHRPADSSIASRQLTLEIFKRGCAHAESKGIIIADTKFEFGLVGDGNPAIRRGPHRRSPDPRLVALLAQGSVQPGGAVPELRQAVRPRLPRRDQVEQAAAGALAARGGHRAHAREVHRRVQAAVRPGTHL